ncbi:MAG TPA: hypothetical protein VGM82_00155 [Gemmatimonadaceae bacterium]|jgi:hypothetical protein
MIKALVDLLSALVQLALVALLLLGGLGGYLLLPHELSLGVDTVTLNDTARTVIGVALAGFLGTIFIGPALILLDIRNAMRASNALLQPAVKSYMKAVAAPTPVVAAQNSSNASLRIPDVIAFSNQVLMVPSLTELGIPKDALPYIRFRPIKRRGDWVERNDAIAHFSVHAFRNEKAPPWPFSDVTDAYEYDILSPTTGLIVDFRREPDIARDNRPSHMNVFNWDDVWPVLLLPEDEPPQWGAQAPMTANHVLDILERQFPLLYSNGTRLGSGNDLRQPAYDKLLADVTAARLATSAANVSQYQFGTRELTSADEGVLYHIQNIRARDYTLRDKLAPVVRQMSHLAR